MRRLLPQLAMLLLLVSAATVLHAGEVIDRILATVNGVAIFQSDVDVAARFEALMAGSPINAVDDAELQRTLERLVDQELLRQQMGTRYPVPSEAEIAERISQVRRQLSTAETDDGWHGVLARYSLSEQEFAERVAVQMQLSRYMDQRLRPTIRIDSAKVEAYYRETLLPELRRSGVQGEPPLAQVRPQIEEILIQQSINEQLSAWVRGLREQGRVIFAPGSGAVNERKPRNPQTETGSAK